MVRDRHCSYCGVPFEPPLSYPRTCARCGATTWANPIPVSVVLVPVVKDERTGLLVIRRGIDPGKGKLALVGGFLEEHERWQEGGARELLEESGVQVDPDTLEPFWFASSSPKPNRVLLFSIAPSIEVSRLGPFVSDGETTERGVVFGPGGLDEQLAFSLHAEAARRFFALRGATGPADYLVV